MARKQLDREGPYQSSETVVVDPVVEGGCPYPENGGTFPPNGVENRDSPSVASVAVEHPGVGTASQTGMNGVLKVVIPRCQRDEFFLDLADKRMLSGPSGVNCRSCGLASVMPLGVLWCRD